MSWKEDVVLEMTRAREAQQQGNGGKVRTAARRSVGIALAELMRRFPEPTYGRDYVAQLRSLAMDERVPQAARDAAMRLQARITHEFKSESVNPIEDAEIILKYVFSRLE
jgi:hypothetical protein